ncbi:unnamed protein product [Taenia asiatica]|uniref:Uncharacterized protein n=1 Tax=Taenia asiatica TaxID=60517 RepID=A0A0R3VXB4_TAEAS|nr:unnamed protein product [Taenia asiatica]
MQSPPPPPPLPPFTACVDQIVTRSGEIGDEMQHRSALCDHIIGVHMPLENHLLNDLAINSWMGESSTLGHVLSRQDLFPHPCPTLVNG